MTSTYGSQSRTIAAGAEERFDISGTFLRCLYASHSDFQLRIDGGAWQYFDQGLKYVADDGDGFGYVSIINNSASPLDITLGYGFGDLDDDRLSLVGGNLPVVPAGGAAFFDVQARVPDAVALDQDTIASGASSTIIAADPNRVVGHLTNHGAGTVHVRDAAAAGIGRPVDPGETFKFRTQAALYVYNPNAASVVVTLFTERFA
jgi:hypothetical protein